MKIKDVHFIINPAAGHDQPILAYINKLFNNSGVNWDVSISHKVGDIQKIAQKHVGKAGLIAIYGGDGCVMELAQELHLTRTPMAILPAGTANVMAKELGIPLDIVEALKLILDSESKLVRIDMGLLNKKPFLIRVNLGIMAEMVVNAERQLKDQLGQFAYGLTAFQSLNDSIPQKFILEIDGKKIEESGVSLTITNSGNIGLGQMTMLPGISITDGKLDVVLMNESNLADILKVAGSTLFQTESSVLKHWKCKEIRIRLNNKQTFICDDSQMVGKELNIKVIPRALNVLVPGLSAQNLFTLNNTSSSKKK